MSSIWSRSKKLFNAHPYVISAITLGLVGYTLHVLDRRDKDITVSAPGKALIAGGYLVLEHPNVGIVISCTSRFYATARTVKCKDYDLHLSHYQPQDQNSNGRTTVFIVIISPQFHSEQVYCYNWVTGHVVQCSESGNTFVEKCLKLVLAFLSRHNTKHSGNGANTNTATSNPDSIEDTDPVFIATLKQLSVQNKALAIKLRANNDFYSQTAYLQKRGLPLLSSSLKLLPAFLPCPINKHTKRVESTL